MNNCSENHSESIGTQNCNSSLTYAGEAGDVIIPILDLAFIVLTVLLGSLIIYCVYHIKTLRDPVSVLIVSVAVTLMVLTIVYSLYCLSILTDLPLIGDCSNPSGNIIVIVITFHFFCVCFTVGLISTVQFLTIKYGRKRVTKQKLLPVFAVLTFLAIVLPVAGAAEGVHIWGAVVKKIIIFIPMRVPYPPPSAPTGKKVVRVKQAYLRNRSCFRVPVSTFQKRTGTPTRF